MRKDILLPAAAVVGGVAGFALRRWELASAFEADTGLPIPGAPATTALIVLSVVMAALLALLCRGRYPNFGGYDRAFAARGNTVYLTCMVLSAFAMLAGAALLVLNFFTGPERVVTRLLLAALCVAAFGGVLAVARNNYRGLGQGKFSLPLLLPAYACCVWLIVAYQVRAGDPVQLDYVYELFAIIASLLGFYFTAAFSFARARPFWTLLFSLLGVYFSITTLADQHDLPTTLLYCFTILCPLTASVTLLHNAALPQPAAGDNDTNDTEGTPHES